MKILLTVLLLTCSTSLMTFAWYGHLSTLKGKFWLIAVLVSWGIAFFEYLFLIPASRLGSQVLTLSQLKILQEVISLSVFVPYAIYFAKQHISWNYLWAALCIAGAVFFIFTDSSSATHEETHDKSTPTIVQKASPQTSKQPLERSEE